MASMLRAVVGWAGNVLLHPLCPRPTRCAAGPCGARPRSPGFRRFVLAAGLGLAAGPAASMPPDADLCDRAAEVASLETGVPLSLLRAVARTESGRAADGDAASDASPWPWTIQHAGTGVWLPSRDAALERAQEIIAAGETNLDLGCFQLNLRWHGAAFPSLEAMLDPQENARYAARHLADLFARTGSWQDATGAYHSGDPERAAAYVDRVRASHARRVAAAPAEAPPDEAAPAAPSQRFGLLRPAGAILTAARGPLVGAP